MRKSKILLLVCIVSAIISGVLPPEKVRAAERALDVAKRYGAELEERYQPAGSIITEINTGQILWQENPNVSWAPASMTKLMSILAAYDAMAEGKFSLDTQVAVTEKYKDIADRYVLSNNKMQMGASYSVSELIDLIIVPSSAAATYMLTDLVEPDPDKFVALMNKKAKEIGMNETTYYNNVGVPSNLLAPYQPKDSSVDKYNVTTPMDYAILCSYFVKNYPEILEHTKDVTLVVKEGTPYEEHFNAYQISLEGAKYGLEGTDGLKTGSSEEGGFNYSSTAKRGDTRLIEVVMGVTTWADQTGEEIRHLVGNAIMEDAFDKYEYKKILPKGEHKIQDTEILLEEDFWDCVPKNQEVPLELKDGKLRVNLERQYLPGYREPTVSYKEKSGFMKMGGYKDVKGAASGVKETAGKMNASQRGEHKVLKIARGITVILLFALMGGLVGYIAYRNRVLSKQNKKRNSKL